MDPSVTTPGSPSALPAIGAPTPSVPPLDPGLVAYLTRSFDPSSLGLGGGLGLGGPAPSGPTPEQQEEQRATIGALRGQHALGNAASFLGSIMAGPSGPQQFGQHLMQDATGQEGTMLRGALAQLAAQGRWDVANLRGEYGARNANVRAGTQEDIAARRALAQYFETQARIFGTPYVPNNLGGTVNKITGATTYGDLQGGAGGGGGGGTFDPRLDKWQKAVEDEATRAVSKLRPQQQLAEKLLAVTQGPNGYNLDKRETMDYAESLGRLMVGSNGRVTQGMANDLIPATSRSKYANWKEYLLNTPEGLDQQAFIQRMEQLVKREYSTVQGQEHSVLLPLIHHNTSYQLTYPDRFAEQVGAWGITPDDLAAAAAARKPVRAPRGGTSEADAAAYVDKAVADGSMKLDPGVSREQAIEAVRQGRIPRNTKLPRASAAASAVPAPAPAPPPPPAGPPGPTAPAPSMIRVRRRSDGASGRIPASSFDPSKYDRL